MTFTDVPWTTPNPLTGAQSPPPRFSKRSTMYPVIGEPPSSRGAFHLRATILVSYAVTSGVPGGPGGSIINLIVLKLEKSKLKIIVNYKNLVINNKHFIKIYITNQMDL